ncbi:MAG: phosphoribosylformylglycinamidine synthase subunit PurQ [Cohaesibacteraceae bacterium]|nr:phosphoribosylformylglycinamidine synthase subunit PurQ [Cohaesibacteraceae bacterium]
MKTAILVFPGSNRERDMATALEMVSGVKPVMVWHQETEIPDVDLIAIPGGFSYGDYLRAGAIAARSPVMSSLRDKAAAGVNILGVCNGFQILTEAGLLPGALMRNAGLHFICREVHLRVENTNSYFTRSWAKNAVIRCPIAHHDGNYFTDPDTLKKLEDQDRVAFRYADENGNVNDTSNPNGSRNNIAGILNDRGNILGMMPHPENLIESLHGGTDGLGLFKSMLENVA